MPEALDLPVRVLASGGVGAIVYWCGRWALEGRRGKNRVAEIEAEHAAEVAKIEANSAAKVAEIKAIGEAQLALESERRKRPPRQLDRPRPPPPT